MNTLHNKLGRAAAVALSAAVVGIVGLVGVAPASAAPEDRYALSGSVVTVDAEEQVVPLEGVRASVRFTEPGETPSHYSVTTGVDGAFVFARDEALSFPVGDYEVVFALEGYETVTVPFSIVDSDVTLPAVTMAAAPQVPAPPTLEPVPLGTVTISGTPVVGNVLTAETSGWPAGTQLSYQWGFNAGERGGDIPGANSSTYTVTNAVINFQVVVIVTAKLTGYDDNWTNAFLETPVSAPKKAPAPAPSDLAAYLAANGSTPQPAASVGLPAAGLNAGATHTANVVWNAQDSWVDVYAFSSPLFVGTFPVVNGVVQVTLTPSLLAQLAVGSHTLVMTGQNSGTVASVAFVVGLPVTGAETAAPLAAGSVLLLLGAALMVVRRRMLASA
ncbi:MULTISPECIES: LPXTG cell wall anchor domain-containing protein [unclassified Salinibacterium]|uniref:LPXTG cell wall anchor domain-containing protein n=1 Tax=unclassified Salinibacterium TaxID=2632331 RepID=UPI00143DD422|nr:MULTISPECIES: LPXTG cell wall anchor domain-containing protein [unclassified Salinibacterium]